MPIRITIGNEQLGPRFQHAMVRQAERVRETVRASALEAKTQIEKRGRADIAKAGNFGSRWIDGFNARVGQGGGHTRITVTHAVPYWTVFQTGKVIHGKPLLWIPLSFATDALRLRARDYPAPLFRVDREGRAPLLLTVHGGEPKYFGKESVTIPKKFHLKEIARDVARSMKDIYRRHFRRIKSKG